MLILTLLLLFTRIDEAPKNNYPSLENVFDQAKNEQKNIMVWFVSDWCDKCSFQQDSVLANPFIKSVLRNDYIYVISKLFEPESKDWFMNFKVTQVPTLLILNPKGQILYKQHEPDEQNLYTHLLDHIPPQEVSNVENQSGLDIPQSVKTVDANMASLSNKDHPILSGSDNHQLIHSNPQYTITVGSFSTFENAQKFIDVLRSKNFEEEIFIEHIQRKNLYRVNMGQFNTRIEYQELFTLLKTKNMDCYARQIISENQF